MTASKSMAMFFTSGPAARECMMMSSRSFSADTISTSPFMGGAGKQRRDGNNLYNKADMYSGVSVSAE